MSTFAVCEAFFSEAGCRARQCHLRHDAFRCTCGAIVLHQSKRSHLGGKKHTKALILQEQARQATFSTTAAEPFVPAPVEDKTEKCQRCHSIIFVVEMAGHIEEHDRRDRIQRMREELAAAEEDKESIKVDSKEGVDFGVIEAGTAEEKKVDMRKTKSLKAVQLVYGFLRSALTEGAAESPFSVTVPKKRTIMPNKPRSVVVAFAPTHDGFFEDTLELVFTHSKGEQSIITRHVYGTAGSQQDHEELKAKEPYRRKKYIPLAIDGPVIPNPRPPIWSSTTWVNVLPKFDPPKDLIKAAFKENAASSRRGIKRLMPAAFNLNTYGAWFQALLFIEGEQKQRDLDRLFTQQGVELQRHKLRYELEVKGVANGRPSVLVGDYVHVREAGDGQTNTWYQGRVHEINQDTLSLHLNDRFSWIRGAKFDVRFIYNRLSERRKHLAVTIPSKPMRILFPDANYISYDRVTPDEVQTLNPINREIKGNYEQCETIAAVLKQPPGTVPFVIFGPPGTGKTVTIVETMRQILIFNPDARILACAPSNAAADTIAEKLVTIGKSELFRLNSLSRSPKDLRSGLKPFSLLNDNNVFAIPPVEELRKYRVIVSTCISAGALWGMGIRKGHFTHIFIDEAGQGQEPDIMVPFLTLADNRTNFILAGDHQQLGPEVHSQIATSYGLQKSYLSRLMAREIYDVEYGRGLTVVKLLKNFRSHPSILEFSNRHFYKSELVACGNPVVTHSLEDIDDLPTKRFPIIFHGIVGKDQREESSPSFFNIEEATLVKKYCQSLLGNRKKRIRSEHIGVITPYHSQKCKIRQLLNRDPKMEGIKVGSVDEFQGQERRVIILSTVRSTPDHVALDMRRSLGFVASPLRLNVAMTRAQALLIVVGNPIVLSIDPLWRSFLNYVHSKGGWRGTTIAWDPTELVNLPSYDAQYRERAEALMEDTITRLKALVSQDLEQYDIDFNEGDDSDDDYAEERVRDRDDE